MTSPVVRSQVPMLHAASVERSVAFYAHLGFHVGNSVTAEDGRLQWVWLATASAALMFARADEPVEARAQALLLYLYTDDVAAMRSHLIGRGLDVGEIATPFYAPRGEFPVIDPDGYCLMITHT
jgi:hypothetical protein